MSVVLDYKNLFNYLININICQKGELKYLKINSLLSENSNWVIELLDKKNIIFVKQIPPFTELCMHNKINKEWSFYNFSKSTYSPLYISDITPEIIYFNKEESILIYKLSDDYQSLKNYHKKSKESLNLIAELIGTSLGKIHYNTIDCKECFTLINEFSQNRFEYQISYPDYLCNKLINFLKPENLKKTPTQAWRFLGILHHAKTAREIVAELLLNNRKYCLTHNNIKFENLFISKHWKEKKIIKDIKQYEQSFMKIINWENCTWGDPACDLGRAVTNYFIIWFDSMLIDINIDIQQSIRLATIPFEVINSSITTLIRAYVKNHPQILEKYPDFLSRVIQFAGLGLIYQLLTELQFQPDRALERQNLYIYMASQLLCEPQKFVSVK